MGLWWFRSSLGQPTTLPGHITPFATVGIGPSGKWEFFNIDNNDSLVTSRVVGLGARVEI